MTAIQWEWADGSEEIRLLEPCDHLDPTLAGLFADERLVGPARAALGVGEVGPFTSKLNLKRAREGSEFPWHQDYPYWYAAYEEDAADMVTAILFLDDATAANGALRVLPGSHLGGPARRDVVEPTGFLADAAALDTLPELVVEVPAGSVIWFGPFSCTARRRTPAVGTAGPCYQPGSRPGADDSRSSSTTGSSSTSCNESGRPGPEAH